MRKILNNYYPTSKLYIESLGKEIRYLFRSCLFFFKNKGKNKRILLFPEYPGSKAIITKIACKSSLLICNNVKKKVLLTIAWKDSSTREVFPELLNRKEKLLNLYNNNILKTYIDEFFYEVFAYKTRIDPENFQGEAVCKSEYNATHSGEIVQCPIDKVKKDCIYQILINNQDENGFFEDIRVPIIANSIPFIYIKRKSENARFETKAIKVEIKNGIDFLTIKEQENILKFASVIGLDFGEIDVLRNRNDNRIYIIDVNNTPYGPPANLLNTESKKAVSLLANSFLSLLQ